MNSQTQGQAAAPLTVEAAESCAKQARQKLLAANESLSKAKQIKTPNKKGKRKKAHRELIKNLENKVAEARVQYRSALESLENIKNAQQK